jgi:hypothetical protein
MSQAMSSNITPLPSRPLGGQPQTRRMRGAMAARKSRETFSTAVFTGLNIAVFLVLAASVVGAAILYSQGA